MVLSDMIFHGGRSGDKGSFEKGYILSLTSRPFGWVYGWDRNGQRWG